MKYSIYFLCLLILPFTARTQTSKQQALKNDIQKIITKSQAHVGVGILGLDFKDSLTINGAQHFPMQSVFKFPLAITILHLVDEHKLSLNQKIRIPASQLDTATWSPMLKDSSWHSIRISLQQLLLYAISYSDNNACDALFRISSTGTTNNYIHSLGVKNISIVATEAAMKKGWQVQYTNWCSPAAMLQLLHLFFAGNVLSKQSNALLLKLMTESYNSEKRIKGLLPAGTVVAHKTGTSNTNTAGTTAATNDVGIITLPNGRHYALVIYVSDYKGGVPKGERIIAEISRAVWDYYTHK